MWLVGPSNQGGNIFFTKYGGPSGGSLLSGGGIIILRVIRRHFLACVRGPRRQPLHAQSTPIVSSVDHIGHSMPIASMVVDDDEALDNNKPEMGRCGSSVADGEVYEG